jgi:NAD(P)H-hydrate repair Nnr-like enzyme with NAD(P)H-hydrate dehydratase domain
MLTFARLALDIAKEQGMFLVLDADGIFMVGHQLHLVRGYRRAVLTPNVVEFKRLSEQAVCVALYTPFERDKLTPVIRALIPTRRPRNRHRRFQRR